ncbi:hypothetical protein SUGI_0030680 [Cryptomeria japonica]|uniref:nuclear pore complex protein NUP50A n=1 Tax=Cryptomeria japonica TaxID=3369 RepID=UPI002408E5E8|nr:nuclear pore complex protein NUP50A [Cryptomeria japonica]GLJ06039.1 hypothetical protein SUGI_0030680 [Cryptomeria japonica]
MGDGEISVTASKKRAARTQLTKDVDFDAENEDGGLCGQETKDFQRASEDVLATRNFFKVCRSQSSSEGASSPFSAVKLAIPSAAPQVEEASKDANEFSNQAEISLEREAIEVGEFALREVDEKENSEAGLIDLNSTGLNSGEPTSGKKELQGESTNFKHTDLNTEETDTGYSNKEETEKEEGAEGEEKTKRKTFERKQPAAVKTFQQLSTAQNAFTGISGTGFSCSSFSFDTKIMPFGSTPKFGSFSTGSAFGSASSTVSVGGTGSFGTKLSSDDLGPSAASGDTCNSSGPLQLFGTAAADTIPRIGSGMGTTQEVSIETGEEKENSVFTADAALFQYINGGWKERGKGELRLNIPTADVGRARLVMRARGNYRLILNANMYPDTKLTGMEKRGFTFACFNSAGEAKEGLGTFALKFKDSFIAEDFQAAIEAHKDRLLTELKTLENSSESVECPQMLNNTTDP